MMFTPCWPKEGPTGGLGVASPAFTCNFTYADTFFLGMMALHPSTFLYLPKFQFHRCRTPKNEPGNSQAVFFIIDVFHDPIKISKRSIGDSDNFTRFKQYFRFRPALTFFHSL